MSSRFLTKHYLALLVILHTYNRKKLKIENGKWQLFLFLCGSEQSKLSMRWIRLAISGSLSVHLRW